MKLIKISVIATSITAGASSTACIAAAPRYYGPVRFHITKKKPVERPVFAHTGITLIDNASITSPKNMPSDTIIPEKPLKILVGSMISKQSQSNVPGVDDPQIIDPKQPLANKTNDQTLVSASQQSKDQPTTQQSEDELMYMFNALIENWLLGLIPKSFTKFSEELILTMNTYKKALKTEQLKTAIMQFMQELDSIKYSKSVFTVGKTLARYKKYLPAYSRIHSLGFFKLKELLTERLAVA